MPAWPGISGYTPGIRAQSDRVDLVNALDGLKVQRGAEGRRLQSASLEDIERDPQMQAYALAVGQSVFGDNCATCHGAGGTGGKGYANLRDDIWLWGGKLDQIHRTISVGVRAGAEDRSTLMPSFGREAILTQGQIGDLTEYVVALSGRKADQAAVTRAHVVYTDECVDCHGDKGKGVVGKGAPDLTDQEWLYGSGRDAIEEQIWKGGGGVMPAWGARFDPATLKALAVYIHANAGGR